VAAARVMVGELAFAAVGKPLPVTLPPRQAMVRGEDKLGQQASLRQKMRPMAALLVLALEMMSIASLVSRELQLRTVVAVLATPVRPLHWVTGKLLFGAFVAFTQALVLLVLIGALHLAPLKLLVLVALGTILFSGVGLIAGARARDFTEVLFYSFACLIPLIIPAFSVLMPGATGPVVQLLPTWPLAMAIFQATSGASWAELLPWIAGTAAWVVALGGLGVVVITRRLVRL
jgi:hypothetical protein